MSSILEALRELEGERARSGPKTTTVVDAPREPQRSLGAVIPLTGGLAIGVVAFGAYVFWSARGVPSLPAPAATGAPAAATQPAAEPAQSGPAWLERAEAPRARVTPPPQEEASARPAAAPAPPVAPAARPAPPPVESRAPAPAAAPVLPKASNVRSGDQQLRVEAISYSDNPEMRTATLRVYGRLATLRQRESTNGVEVQLIMSDGVYVQRGSDVFFVPASR
jgi:hypothetical protein